MTCFISDGHLIHSRYPGLGEFCADVFAGRPMLTDIRSRFLPEKFPVAFGSVLEPGLLGLENSPHYLFDYATRMERALELLIAGFFKKVPAGLPFDACFFSRSPGIRFNFSKSVEGNRAGPHLSGIRIRDGLVNALNKSAGSAFKQENITVLSGTCASGLITAGLIASQMKRNNWRRVLAVGIDLFSIERSWTLAGLGAAASHQSSEELIQGPFSSNRKGFIQSEAAAVLLFESEAGLRERGAGAFSRVSNFYQNADGETLTAGSANGAQIERCMREAGKNRKITTVKAHGTGTVLNDASEGGAIGRAFSDPLVLSFKGQIGHTLDASGFVELLLCNEIFKRSRAPACLNLQELDPKINARLLTEASAFHEDHILLNSFGFGGFNASLLLARA